MRLTAVERRTQILDIALELAESGHYLNLTREGIARAGGFHGELIHYHFGTMAKFRRAVMREAVQRRCLRVIGQGVVASNDQALEADDELRDMAVKSLLTKM